MSNLVVSVDRKSKNLIVLDVKSGRAFKKIKLETLLGSGNRILCLSLEAPDVNACLLIQSCSSDNIKISSTPLGQLLRPNGAKVKEINISLLQPNIMNFEFVDEEEEGEDDEKPDSRFDELTERINRYHSESSQGPVDSVPVSLDEYLTIGSDYLKIFDSQQTFDSLKDMFERPDNPSDPLLTSLKNLARTTYLFRYDNLRRETDQKENPPKTSPKKSDPSRHSVHFPPSMAERWFEEDAEPSKDKLGSDINLLSEGDDQLDFSMAEFLDLPQSEGLDQVEGINFEDAAIPFELSSPIDAEPDEEDLCLNSDSDFNLGLGLDLLGDGTYNLGSDPDILCGGEEENKEPSERENMATYFDNLGEKLDARENSGRNFLELTDEDLVKAEDFQLSPSDHDDDNDEVVELTDPDDDSQHVFGEGIDLDDKILAPDPSSDSGLILEDSEDGSQIFEISDDDDFEDPDKDKIK